MKSMTGFGESSVENETYRVTATIRSVNQRFLDFVIRLADDHRALETSIAERLRSKLVRGRVEVRVVVDPLGEKQVEIGINESLLSDLLAAIEPLRKRGLIKGDLGVQDLIRLPQVLTVGETPPGWTEADDALVSEAVDRALGQVVEARDHEGGRLEEVLLARVAELEELAARLESARLSIEQETLGNLRTRLTELVEGAQIPEERLAQEAAILVEKSDVREELDRLVTHLGHFRTLCAGDGPHGRRLEFLVQELQRELNTLGGKCRDGEMARQVVEGKLFCEQLREQLLNVE